MGAWGYGALDSDQALDWMSGALGPIADRIDALLKDIENDRYYTEGELRAAAHLFCATNLDFHAAPKTDANASYASMRDRLIEALYKHRNSKDMDYWDDPQKARGEIDKEIARLRDPENHGQPRSTTLMDNLGG